MFSEESHRRHRRSYSYLLTRHLGIYLFRIPMKECKHTRLADDKMLFRDSLGEPCKFICPMRTFMYGAVFYRVDISWRI